MSEYKEKRRALLTLMTDYLEAVLAKDPSGLPIAPDANVRYNGELSDGERFADRGGVPRGGRIDEVSVCAFPSGDAEDGIRAQLSAAAEM